jgi:hypothetical protein
LTGSNKWLVYSKRRKISKEVFTMRDVKYYFPGITLIAIAVIIVAFPEILIALIAATIICAGAIALYIGHKVRKGFDEFSYINGSTFEKFLIDQPIFRRWYYRL